MANRDPEVQYLLDRQAIIDCIYRYARGVDRHDVDIMRTVFHPDATDNHGNFLGNVDEFVKWVNGVHEKSYRAHTHNITCHNCEIEGDVAHTESYVIFVLQTIDEQLVYIGGGRYLDRFEKRNGEWRIALRRTMVDWRCKADGGEAYQAIVRSGYPRGTWDRDDLSYLRPLTLPR
jgi:hypothetical protein